MKNPTLFLLAFCAAMLLAPDNAALARSQPNSKPPEDNSPVDADPARGVAASSPDDQFTELGLENFRSAFTRETVLKLNAIVSRSLETVTRYDDEIPKIEAAIERARSSESDAAARKKADAGLALLTTLSEQASAAHADMLVASEQVRTSGEIYNAPLLSGMNRFVRRVDEEIRDKLATLKARLSSAESD